MTRTRIPLDPSGTGGTFLHPEALRLAGANKIGLIRVDLPQASALKGLLDDLYGDRGVTFPYDVGVPAGTTDFSQFILGAEEAGADGVTLNLGEQEAVQVVRAGQQLGTDLLIGAGLGTFSLRDGRRARRLRRAVGVRQLVPAGDLRPARLRGAPGRPGGLGGGGAPAREPEGQPDAIVDRSVRPAADDPGRQDDRVQSRGHHARC